MATPRAATPIGSSARAACSRCRSPAAASEQAIRERRVVTYRRRAERPGRAGGARAGSPGSSARRIRVAVAPMLWEGEAIGVDPWSAARSCEPFDDKEHRLLRDLRRPGGDRDPERAAVQRDQGGARAADRDGRGAAGHQQLGRRHAAGVRQDPRQLRAAVRGDRAGHLSRRRRRPAAHGAASAASGRSRERALGGKFPRAARRHRDRAARSASAASSTTPTCSPTPDVPASLRRHRRGRAATSRIAFAPMLWEGRGVGAISGLARAAGAVHATRSWRCSRPSPTRR